MCWHNRASIRCAQSQFGPLRLLSPGMFNDLDAEIRSVSPQEQLFTPDDLRGDHATLEDAVLTDG